MADYYIYLISSLPSLAFGAKPPFSFDAFLARCRGLVPDEDLAVIGTARSGTFTCAGVKNETLRRWLGFETMLRNELVGIRASRRKTDPARYLRKDGCPESVYAAHIAINAYRKTSPLDAEKALDLDRWRYLDELSAGHYFDIDILIIYACKLLILEKWDAVHSADAHKLLEEALV